MQDYLFLYPYVFITCGTSRILFYDSVESKQYVYECDFNQEDVHTLEKQYVINYCHRDKQSRELAAFIIGKHIGGVSKGISQPFVRGPKYIIKHQSTDSNESSYYYLLSYLSQIKIDCRGLEDGSIFSKSEFDASKSVFFEWIKGIEKYKQLKSLCIDIDSQTSLDCIKCILKEMPNRVEIRAFYHGNRFPDSIRDLVCSRKHYLGLVFDTISFPVAFDKSFEDVHLFTFVKDTDSLLLAKRLKNSCDNLIIMPSNNADDSIMMNCSYDMSDLMKISHTIKDLNIRKRVNAFFWGKVIINHQGMYESPYGENCSIFNTSIVDQLRFELDRKGLWFFTRDRVQPCCNCAFRYLCPSISSIEIESKHFNLCTIEPC